MTQTFYENGVRLS